VVNFLVNPLFTRPVHGLVDRFVADMPRLLLRVGFAEPETDLLRAPVLSEFLLHEITQYWILTDSADSVTAGFLS